MAATPVGSAARLANGTIRAVRGAADAVVDWALARLPMPGRVRWEIWKRLHPPSEFVLRHLAGMSGIEIGASAHNDYGLRALNVDRYPGLDTVYKREERRHCGRIRDVDVVAPGDDLPFPSSSVDFVFASHVIEHFPDPIGALGEWCRVARHRVVVVVPHPDRTFDAGRDPTPVPELLERHERAVTSDDDRHWSVWTCETFLEMCTTAGFRVLDSLDPDDKVGNGFIVVIDAATTTP